MAAMDTAPLIDCDIHPTVPGTEVLLPYMDDYWADQITGRGIDGLDLASYPPKNPLTARQDWRASGGKPGASLERLKAEGLDGFGSTIGICNVLYGAEAAFNPYFAAALCRATNDWIAREWLDREPGLRASILVPLHDPQLAVEEIERCAADRRFVQVLLLTNTEMPLGRRQFWPLYETAERHGLTIGIHAGSTYRHPPTYIGWPSYYIEHYAAFSTSFQGQLLNMVYEGVFQKYPKLRVVLLESGVTWLPQFLWRADNTWRALRMEVPWVDRPPSTIIREHVRLTTQPLDVPDRFADMPALLDQIGSDDMLLFATDYPHWQFDGDRCVHPEMPTDLVARMRTANPLATYPRLDGALQ
ncbi:amidohydrolase family protein [Shinella sp. BYT-45]|uniref:amidohydrolase family protein n=1 Tax=Shinella sp. BYT-45 TaxID=3377377 RepID=UPI003980C802